MLLNEMGHILYFIFLQEWGGGLFGELFLFSQRKEKGKRGEREREKEKKIIFLLIEVVA